MSMLATVQQKHPEVKEIIPALKPLALDVTTKHRKGAKANHWDCTISRAVKEATGAIDVCTMRSSVVAIFEGGKAVQYAHGSGSRDIVTINDSRGEVVDQTVWLNAPNQKQRIVGILKQNKNGVPGATLGKIAQEYKSRINELRNSGYEISSVRGCDGKVSYRLDSEPKTASAGKKYAPRVERKYRRVERADVLRDRA